MQQFKCHKVVEAAKILQIGHVIPEGEHVGKRGIVLLGEPPVWEPAGWFDAHKVEVGGYYVRYKDGYTSFSPAEAFEAGYTAITPQTDTRHQEAEIVQGEHILQFFQYAHLPPYLQDVSQPFAELAFTIMKGKRSPERTVALRKLLECKDAAVRNALEDKQP